MSERKGKGKRIDRVKGRCVWKEGKMSLWVLREDVSDVSVDVNVLIKGLNHPRTSRSHFIHRLKDYRRDDATFFHPPGLCHDLEDRKQRTGPSHARTAVNNQGGCGILSVDR